jgi:putative redox protein
MTERVTNSIEVVLDQGMRFEARDNGRVAAILDGSPPADGAGMSPMMFLLAGLGGCTAMDVIQILRKKRQDVTDYRVEVQGLKAETHPAIYTDIDIRHIITGRQVSEQAVQHAIELSEEKYCSVSAMLKQAATITSSFEVRETEDSAPRD